MSQKEIIKNNDELISDLTGFFDLLAKYDHEDKQKSVLKTDSLVSAPKESVLDSDK